MTQSGAFCVPAPISRTVVSGSRLPGRRAADAAPDIGALDRWCPRRRWRASCCSDTAVRHQSTQRTAANEDGDDAADAARSARRTSSGLICSARITKKKRPAPKTHESDRRPSTGFQRAEPDRSRADPGAGSGEVRPRPRNPATKRTRQNSSRRASRTVDPWSGRRARARSRAISMPESCCSHSRRVYTCSRSSVRLTSSMTFVTSMSRGQASVQLKIVRQRQTPDCVFRMRRRSAAPSVAAVVDEAVRR